jgi:hypothetical protein
MVSPAHPDLWTLALDEPQVGPSELADAIEREAGRQPLDFRTRLLIRDSVAALGVAWGQERVAQWLAGSPQRRALEEIAKSQLGPPGFSLLHHRIMEPTRTESVLQFFRELGQSIGTPVTVAVGGSVALILAGVLSRRTEDIDIVDEVPVQIRSEHVLLDELARRYGLKLTHFQSHYLPAGWESRLHRLDSFGRLEVRLVDPCDIFVGKLFSKREKDLDDLRVLAGRIDKQAIVQRVRDAAGAFMGDDDLRRQGEKNWYILHGEALPG